MPAPSRAFSLSCFPGSLIRICFGSTFEFRIFFLMPGSADAVQHLIHALETGGAAVWIRRGPWGVIQAPPALGIAALQVESLAELVQHIGDAWPGANPNDAPATSHDEVLE